MFQILWNIWSLWQVLNSAAVAGKRHTQYMGEWGWSCANNTLPIHLDLWTHEIFTFQEILASWFPTTPTFKNVEAIVCSQTIQKQEVHCVCPKGYIFQPLSQIPLLKGKEKNLVIIISPLSNGESVSGQELSKCIFNGRIGISNNFFLWRSGYRSLSSLSI